MKRGENDVWETLVKPGKKAKPGTRISFGDGLLVGEVVDVVEEGNRLIHFEYKGIFEEILDQLGQMPLPPYITHQLEDRSRYNTVYAVHEGSAAAPTAGLHFTPKLLKEIQEKGRGYCKSDTSCRTGHIPPGESGGCDRAPHAFGVLHGGCRSGREASTKPKNMEAAICVGTKVVVPSNLRDENGRLKPAAAGQKFLSIRDISLRY